MSEVKVTYAPKTSLVQFIEVTFGTIYWRTLQCSPVLCSARCTVVVVYSAVQCSMVQCSGEYSAVQCSTVQCMDKCSAVQSIVRQMTLKLGAKA